MAYLTGRVNKKTEPYPTWLVTRIVPECASRTAFAIASPTQLVSAGARFISLPRNSSFWFISQGIPQKVVAHRTLLRAVWDQTVRNSLSIYGSSSVSFARRLNPKHRHDDTFIPNLGLGIDLIRQENNLLLFRG